ncbi:hypothetical protein [Sessilibacter sp. MAH4]
MAAVTLFLYRFDRCDNPQFGHVAAEACISFPQALQVLVLYVFKLEFGTWYGDVIDVPIDIESAEVG